MLNVKVKKLTEDAILPTYATGGSACFDLYSIENTTFAGSNVFRTGLAFEIPEGYVMLVYSRSGHGFKADIRLANCVGVIDSDYRGELLIKLTIDSNLIHVIGKGERIAQAMIVPYQSVLFEEVDELGTTERGVGGFGSSGV